MVSAVVMADRVLIVVRGHYRVIEHGIGELGIRMQGYPPRYDLAVEAIDHRRQVAFEVQQRELGDVGESEHVRDRCMEVAFDQVRGMVADLSRIRAPAVLLLVGIEHFEPLFLHYAQDYLLRNHDGLLAPSQARPYRPMPACSALGLELFSDEHSQLCILIRSG